MHSRFELFNREGVINVNGPARIDGSDAGERIIATFTEAELRWGSLRYDDVVVYEGGDPDRRQG